MKTKQTKIERSAAKWLPGAMALAATTASSQAATVQITLTGNKISSTGGNQLNADLTGDLIADVTIDEVDIKTAGGWRRVNVNINRGIGGGRVRASWSNNYFYADALMEGGTAYVGLPARVGGIGSPKSARTLNPITFTDSRINNGAQTAGWLEVYAFNEDATNHTVELTRLIFDDADTSRPGILGTVVPAPFPQWGAVPEPSSLGLLALGAGGLLLRRSRAKAAA